MNRIKIPEKLKIKEKGITYYPHCDSCGRGMPDGWEDMDFCPECN